VEETVEHGSDTLTAAQAAARLNIRTESLYAYVSRGMLQRRRTAHGSLFDALEVERFARSRRRSPRSHEGVAPTAGSDGRPLAVIDTDISLIEDGLLWFRGRESADLARTATYDSVVEWLLTRDENRLAESRPLRSAPDAARGATRTVAALPSAAPASSRLLTAVAALAAVDPLRFDLSEGAVVATCRRLVAGLVDALPLVGDAPLPTAHIAARLWPRLTIARPTPQRVRALNAALVLLVDHDMAVSTVAARAAASARAHPYAVVAAGLGALDSAVHGAASTAVHAMLADAVRWADPERAVADWARRTPYGVPGFGQPLYPAGDPRAVALQAIVRECLAGDERGSAALDVADALVTLVVERTGIRPSIDFALGAMTVAFDMPADGGELVFGVARSAGWCCHAIAEYAMPALRMRPIGRYVGPPPGGPGPM
jgi:citrate synthase